MKKKIAVLGATGAVGRQMLECLIERDFPCEIKCLASARSAGKELECLGRTFIVEEAGKDSFHGVDIVLGAAGSELVAELLLHIRAAGAVLIDNSSAFRLMDDVPLVVPEINPEDAKKHNGVIANPNCSTVIAVMAVNALRKISPIKSMIASTYQAVSGAGAGGVVELEEQVRAYAAGEEMKISQFAHQIAFNLIPQIGSDSGNGYTSEEMKMQNESRKILHLPDLKVTCTCVRVPVMRSHSISLTVVTERKITVAEAREAIANAPGCMLVDDLEKNEYPMPLSTSDQDVVFVGRIRDDLVFENGLTLFCAGDQVRKGAATNTVQIAELLL
ncbi:MAG: aspartate-semialdehyde dehydrogenase [Christensenellales bacterium]|jgi:aspartate-semialdehyde dehydrogenase